MFWDSWHFGGQLARKVPNGLLASYGDTVLGIKVGQAEKADNYLCLFIS